MRVLVTRPEPEASTLARQLEALGHEPLVAPLTRIEQLPVPPGVADGATAYILTSARAAPALSSLPKLPTFAVGEATAQAARVAGALDVTAADGDWRDLAATVASAGLEPGAVLLHLAGEEVRGRLGEALASHGLAYRRLTLYRAVAVSALDPAVRAALERGSLDAATFLSPRAAHIWCSLVRQAGLEACLRRVRAACMSTAVAEPLAGLGFAAVRVADEPAVEAVLRCLDG